MSSAARIRLRRPKLGAQWGLWLTVLAGLAVAVAMVLVAQNARKDSERHLRAQVLVERIRAASQELSTISSEALANSWSSGSQRMNLEPDTVTRAYTAWADIDRSLKELRVLEGDGTARTLDRDAAAMYKAGVGALAIARSDLGAALADERRRFQPRLRRLNTDAKQASMHQQEVAQRASRSAGLAFVGSLVFGLLALGLIVLRFQRLRRRATLAEELHAIERRSEERLRALVEHSHDVITVVDRDLVVRWQAASVQSMLGHEPASLLGRPLTTIVDPDEADVFERVVLAACSDPERAGERALPPRRRVLAPDRDGRGEPFARSRRRGVC